MSKWQQYNSPVWYFCFVYTEKLLEKTTIILKSASGIPAVCIRSYSRNTGKSNTAGGRSIANIKCQAVTQETVVGRTGTTYFTGGNTYWHVLWKEGKTAGDFSPIDYKLVIYCILKCLYFQWRIQACRLMSNDGVQCCVHTVLSKNCSNLNKKIYFPVL